MKAYEIRQFGVDELVLADRDVPKPDTDEVLVRLYAASINYRDLMVVKGTYNPRMKFPTVPFSDGAGEVIEVGEGVTEWKPGDRVMPIVAQHWYDGSLTEAIRRTSLGSGPHWDGTLREYGTFGAASLVRIPDHLSYEEAATLPCAAITAWHALVEAGRLKAGETVLTLGTGGVSVFAVQLAKMSGAKVISTSSSSDKIAKLRELGADEAINYRDVPEWDKAVLELTGGTGVDHVIEVGGAGTLPKSVRAVRFGGHIGMIGALSGAGSFDPVAVFMKNVRVSGIYIGSKRIFEEMDRAVEENKMRPVIDRVFPFAEAREALKYMESGSHFGKVVVRIGE